MVQELQKLGDSKDFKGHELTPVLLHAEILLESIKGDQIKREKLESKIDDLQEALRIAENERKKELHWVVKNRILSPITLLEPQLL